MMQSSSRGPGQDLDAQPERKQFTIVIVSSLFLVAMVVAVAVNVSHPRNGSSENPNTNHVAASVKAIQSICQPADYRETCVKSLSAASASNATNPKELVEVSFKVAMEHINSVFNESKTLQDAQKDPRTAEALQNCQELLDYSLDDLQRALGEVQKFDIAAIHKVIEDLKVWLSASLTFQDTCLYGFENTTGDAGTTMRKAMNISSQMTTNALAIVNGLSDIFSQLKLPLVSRKLLAAVRDEDEEEYMVDNLPEWVDEGKRRLLDIDIDKMKPNVVVAMDGTGDYKTITEAIATIPLKSTTHYIIHIKKGVYKEKIKLTKKMTNVVFVGDGPTDTVITGDLNFIDGITTYKTCTVAIIGNGFIGKNFGVENTAGAAKHQAVALLVQSDESIFYNCQIDGYQDTLYAHTHRQFYRDCTISGTIDYIFGNSACILQNCKIVTRKPLSNQRNIITAHGRKNPKEPTALVLQNCSVVADPAYQPFIKKNPTFLGRPWREFSRTLYIQSMLGDLINPVGWLPWGGDFGLNTCFYVEFDNRGPGSGTSLRVKWRGVKTLEYENVEQFTVENFLEGEDWIKPTGVPYIPGMLPVVDRVPVGAVGPVAGIVGPPGAGAPAVMPGRVGPLVDIAPIGADE